MRQKENKMNFGKLIGSIAAIFGAIAWGYSTFDFQESWFMIAGIIAWFSSAWIEHSENKFSNVFGFPLNYFKEECAD